MAARIEILGRPALVLLDRKNPRRERVANRLSPLGCEIVVDAAGI